MSERKVKRESWKIKENWGKYWRSDWKKEARGKEKTEKRRKLIQKKKFMENETLRQPDKKRLKTSIDWVLAKSPGSLEAMINALKKEGVQAVLRENKQGLVFGITFIDFRTKAVFNGSDVGKTYSIAGIRASLEAVQQDLQNAPKPPPETAKSK